MCNNECAKPAREFNFDEKYIHLVANRSLKQFLWEIENQIERKMRDEFIDDIEPIRVDLHNGKMEDAYKKICKLENYLRYKF